jgi:hypothetical protein
MNGFVIRDTHKLIAKLQQRGFSAQEAEGITEAIKEIDAAGLATKEDVQLLRQEIRDLKISLIQWIISIQLGYGAIIVGVLALL